MAHKSVWILTSCDSSVDVRIDAWIGEARGRRSHGLRGPSDWRNQLRWLSELVLVRLATEHLLSMEWNSAN